MLSLPAKHLKPRVQPHSERPTPRPEQAALAGPRPQSARAEPKLQARRRDTLQFLLGRHCSLPHDQREASNFLSELRAQRDSGRAFGTVQHASVSPGGWCLRQHVSSYDYSLRIAGEIRVHVRITLMLQRQRSTSGGGNARLGRRVPCRLDEESISDWLDRCGASCALAPPCARRAAGTLQTLENLNQY